MFLPVCAFAQGGADQVSADYAGPVRELSAIHPKTVVFVFDVSGSMRGDSLRRAREATVNILRDGTSAGDRVVLYTFGAATTKVFDQTLANEAAKNELVQEVPSKPAAGEGTNIRRPHYEALKILDASLPKAGAVVLLTDSYNDEPSPTDPAYADYLKFYTPGGQLTKYPDTPENRDYERLLSKLGRLKQIRQYGIGIGLDPGTSRPIERLPVAEHMDTAPAATATPAPAPEPEKPSSPLPWVLTGAVALAALLGGLFAAPRLRAVPLRITTGAAASTAKDFPLKSGQTVKLGGKGANFAADAYPLTGLDEPAATVRASAGQLRIAPVKAAAPAAAGNPPAGPRVFHNGLPLEKEEPLAYGDEVRVSIPAPDGIGPGRDIRLKFDDPRKAY